MSITAQSLVTGFKKYPIIAICGVVSLGLLATIYLRSDLIELQQKELDDATAEGKRHLANVSNSSQLADQLEFLAQANRNVRARAIHPADLAQNLQYFYRIESETGVRLAELKPGSVSAQKVPPSPYLGFSYTVTAQGNFEQIITFLHRLERGTHFCRINTVTVTTVGTLISINLNLELLSTP